MNGRGVAVQEAETHLQVRAEARQVTYHDVKGSPHRWVVVTGADIVSPPCGWMALMRSIGGRWRFRTADLFGVNEARYHCANRPCSVQLYRTYQGGANPLV